MFRRVLVPAPDRRTLGIAGRRPAVNTFCSTLRSFDRRIELSLAAFLGSSTGLDIPAGSCPCFPMANPPVGARCFDVEVVRLIRHAPFAVFPLLVLKRFQVSGLATSWGGGLWQGAFWTLPGFLGRPAAWWVLRQKSHLVGEA